MTRIERIHVSMETFTGEGERICAGNYLQLPYSHAKVLITCPGCRLRSVEQRLDVDALFVISNGVWRGAMDSRGAVETCETD